MIRPRIGLNCDTTSGPGGEPRAFLKSAYASRVVEAGGVPVLLTPDAGADGAAALLALVDGLILTGGDDYPPQRYGAAEVHPAVELVSPARDSFDFALIDALDRSSLPVLGLCNGMQLMAIAAGGRLHQHLPDDIGEQVRHKEPRPGAYLEHAVEIEPGTRLAALIGAGRREVNTRHHQAVSDAGSLRVSARGDDGLIEAVEAGGERFYLGVQWHPEEPGAGEDGQRLFAALVQAAGAGR